MAFVLTGICERNHLIREGIKSYLNGTSFQVITEFKDILAINSQMADQPLHLIIIGFNANEIFPYPIDSTAFKQQISKIKTDFPDARIVVLVSQEDISTRPDMFLCDADGYIINNTCSEALINYLQLAIAGEMALPASIASCFAKRQMDIELQSGNTLSFHPHLSMREREIIRCLMFGESNKLIAKHLDITESTVKVHLKAILRKLGVHNRTQVALWAIDNGFEMDAKRQSA